MSDIIAQDIAKKVAANLAAEDIMNAAQDLGAQELPVRYNPAKDMDPREICSMCRLESDIPLTVSCAKCKSKIHAACSKERFAGENGAEKQVICAANCVMQIPRGSVVPIEFGSDEATPERPKGSDDSDASNSSDSSVVLTEPPLFKKGTILLYNCTTFFSDVDEEIVGCAGGKVGLLMADVRFGNRIAVIKTKMEADIIPGRQNERIFTGPVINVRRSTLCEPSRHILFEMGKDIQIFGVPQLRSYQAGTTSLTNRVQWGIRVKMFQEIGNVIDRVADIFSTDYIAWAPAHSKENSARPGKWPLIPNRDNVNYNQLSSAVICGFSPLKASPTSATVEWNVVLFADWVPSMLTEDALTIDDDGQEEDSDYALGIHLRNSNSVRSKLFCMPLKQFRSQLMTQAKYVILGSARDMENRTEIPKLLEKAVFLADGVMAMCLTDSTGDLTETFTMVQDFEELAFELHSRNGNSKLNSNPPVSSSTSPSPKLVSRALTPAPKAASTPKTAPKTVPMKSSTTPKRRRVMPRAPRLGVELENIDRDTLHDFEEGPYVSAQQRRWNAIIDRPQQPSPSQDPTPEPKSKSKKKPGPKAKTKIPIDDSETRIHLQSIKRLETQKEALQLKNKTQQEALESSKAQIADQIKKLKVMEQDNCKLKSKVEILSEEVVHLTRKIEYQNSAAREVRKAPAARGRPNNRLSLKPRDDDFDSSPMFTEDIPENSTPEPLPMQIPKLPVVQQPTLMTSPVPPTSTIQSAQIEQVPPATITPELFSNLMMRFLQFSGDQIIFPPAATPAATTATVTAPLVKEDVPQNDSATLALHDSKEVIAKRRKAKGVNEDRPHKRRKVVKESEMSSSDIEDKHHRGSRKRKDPSISSSSSSSAGSASDSSSSNSSSRSESNKSSKSETSPESKRKQLKKLRKLKALKELKELEAWMRKETAKKDTLSPRDERKRSDKKEKEREKAKKGK